MALLQKFGLFLGHPNYALSVVLAALLLATGLGSLFSGTIVRRLAGIRFVSYALCGIVLAELLFLFPRLPALASLPFAVRVSLVFALVAPIGVCLGVVRPERARAPQERGAGLRPLGLGRERHLLRLAPVLAIAVSIGWGISALLLVSLPVYLAVGWSLPSSGRRAPDAPG